LEVGVVIGRKEDGELELVLMSFFNLNILSAIIFSIVLIYLAFTSTFELIMSLQKNLARAQPIIDFLLMCRVQFSTLVLSVTH
jgi:hypothetical protein